MGGDLFIFTFLDIEGGLTESSSLSAARQWNGCYNCLYECVSWSISNARSIRCLDLWRFHKFLRITFIHFLRASSVLRFPWKRYGYLDWYVPLLLIWRLSHRFFVNSVFFRCSPRRDSMSPLICQLQIHYFHFYRNSRNPRRFPEIGRRDDRQYSKQGDTFCVLHLEEYLRVPCCRKNNSWKNLATYQSTPRKRDRQRTGWFTHQYPTEDFGIMRGV